MTGLEFWGEDMPADGSVPAVDASDMKKMWTTIQDTVAQHDGEKRIGIGKSAFANVCSPGANPAAVWYRVSMVQIITEQIGLLSPEMPTEVSDVVFHVASKFPMRRLDPGVKHQGVPFDAEGFVRQIKEEMSKLGYELPDSPS